MAGEGGAVGGEGAGEGEGLVDGGGGGIGGDGEGGGGEGADRDVEACVRLSEGGIAGEDGLVVVIALCGFAESEGVGAVGGGGGGAVGAPDA